MIRIYKEASAQCVYYRPKVFSVSQKTLIVHPRPLSEMMAEMPDMRCH